MSESFQSHPVFDIEDRIIEAGNQPSPVNLKPWQDQIDRIVGKTPEGKSRVRIVWGQSYEQTKMICFDRWVLKYPFWRVRNGEEIQDIGKPRFFVEELHGNAELNRKDAWENARYSWINGVRWDVLGPIPEEGYYECLFQIAHHDHLCCGGKGVIKNVPCMGAYREPIESDMERIRQMYFRREQASNDEIAPSPELIQKHVVDATEARDEKWRVGIKETIEDFMRTHGHRFNTHDPGVLRNGKYHFMGGHSTSGKPFKDRFRTLREIVDSLSEKSSSC